MNRGKKLVKNTIIITIGKLCTQLITFLLLPLYTGILSTSEYGIVDLLNTLVALCLPLVTFQVEQAIFRELIEVRNEQNKKELIISSGFYTIIFQSLVFLVLFIIISNFFDNNYKFFLAGNVIVHIFLSLFLQISRGFGDNKKYAFGSFLSAAATIIFNIIFIVIIRFGAYGMLLGTMVGQLIAVIYLFFIFRLYKYIKFKQYKKEIVKRLWKYSLPLIPNAISWWIFNASDRVIATNFLGVAQNGILAASLKFSAVYTNLYGVFNMSWTESISMAIKDKDLDSYFNNTFDVVMRLFISMAICIIAFIPFVFPIMINDKFSTGYGLVPISIVGSLFNVVVGLISVIYVGKKNTKAIANTSIVSAIINVIIHLLLIKTIGLYAAVISTFSAFFIMSIYRILDINKKYFTIKLNWKLIIETVIILAIILYTYYLDNNYLNILSIIISLIFAYLINKKSIKVILRMIRTKINK